MFAGRVQQWSARVRVGRPRVHALRCGRVVSVARQMRARRTRGVGYARGPFDSTAGTVGDGGGEHGRLKTQVDNQFKMLVGGRLVRTGARPHRASGLRDRNV